MTDPDCMAVTLRPQAARRHVASCCIANHSEYRDPEAASGWASGEPKLIGRLWRTAWLLMLAPPLFWSGNFVIGRAVHGMVPPVALAFWRWAGAFAVALPFAWPHLGRDLPVLRRHWAMTLLLSVTGVAAFNTMAYIGLQSTTALNAILLQSVLPLCIIAWVAVLFGERPGPAQTLGILVSLAGVAVIAGQGSLQTLATLSFNPGDLWVIGAVICYALYSALLRKRAPVHQLSFLLASFAIGTLSLLPVYAAELAEGRFIRWGVPALSAIVYVAIFPSFLAYLAFNRGVELIGAGRAGQYVHLMQVFGTILAVVFLGEIFHMFHAVGIALIAAGLLLANRR
jgi:drug/metabolite transporter (DMT)-like permease